MFMEEQVNYEFNQFQYKISVPCPGYSPGPALLVAFLLCQNLVGLKDNFQRMSHSRITRIQTFLECLGSWMKFQIHENDKTIQEIVPLTTMKNILCLYLVN